MRYRSFYRAAGLFRAHRWKARWRWLWGAIAAGTVLATNLPLAAQDWMPVRAGIHHGISGMAVLEHTPETLSLLVVHDNKGDADEPRLAGVSLGDRLRDTPLPWPDTVQPVDLEALTAIPGLPTPGFMALSSGGEIYHIEVSAQQDVRLRRVFRLPSVARDANFEGLSLQAFGNRLWMFWGDRGQDDRLATLHWGELDPATYTLQRQNSAQIRVPWPTTEVRHLSDLRVDSGGVVYLSTAMDQGNDGPFASAVYIIGTMQLSAYNLQLNLIDELVPLYRSQHHKIEALELLPGPEGGILLGTDDENFGGWLRRP